MPHASSRYYRNLTCAYYFSPSRVCQYYSRGREIIVGRAWMDMVPGKAGIIGVGIAAKARLIDSPHHHHRPNNTHSQRRTVAAGHRRRVASGVHNRRRVPCPVRLLPHCDRKCSLCPYCLCLFKRCPTAQKCAYEWKLLRVGSERRSMTPGYIHQTHTAYSYVTRCGVWRSPLRLRHLISLLLRPSYSQ